MHALTGWYPFKELVALRHGLANLLGRSRIYLPEVQKDKIRAPERAPLVDISEDDNEYLIQAELPEVKEKDVEVAVEEGTLTITGERKFELNHRKDHPVENTSGHFAHTFSLPADARPAEISVAFKNGVFSVHLAKHDMGRLNQVEAEAAVYDSIPDHEYHSSGWGINE